MLVLISNLIYSNIITLTWLINQLNQINQLAKICLKHISSFLFINLEVVESNLFEGNTSIQKLVW